MRGKKQPARRGGRPKVARSIRGATGSRWAGFAGEAWGQGRPQDLPGYYFPAGTILDYGTAIRADIPRQNFGVGRPRAWYIDASIRCRRCGHRFLFSAPEQQLWYEVLRFNVGAQAIHCRACRRESRQRLRLRREYELNIKASLLKSAPDELKTRLIAIIDRLAQTDEARSAVSRINEADARRLDEYRQILVKQLARPE